MRALQHQLIRVFEIEAELYDDDIYVDSAD